MSKVTKKELRQRCIDNETAIARLESILKENGIERKPQLKQLDQSVFDGLDERWRFASVDADGAGFIFSERPELTDYFWGNIYGSSFDRLSQSGAYDTTNWQNSLIERDKVELTGSDLCRKMLERGDKYVMCLGDDGVDVIHDLACFVSSTHPYVGRLNSYKAVTPINNQGEPLTAAEAGL